MSDEKVGRANEDDDSELDRANHEAAHHAYDPRHLHEINIVGSVMNRTPVTITRFIRPPRAAHQLGRQVGLGPRACISAGAATPAAWGSRRVVIVATPVSRPDPSVPEVVSKCVPTVLDDGVVQRVGRAGPRGVPGEGESRRGQESIAHKVNIVIPLSQPTGPPFPILPAPAPIRACGSSRGPRARRRGSCRRRRPMTWLSMEPAIAIGFHKDGSKTTHMGDNGRKVSDRAGGRGGVVGHMGVASGGLLRRVILLPASPSLPLSFPRPILSSPGFPFPPSPVALPVANAAARADVRAETGRRTHAGTPARAGPIDGEAGLEAVDAIAKLAARLESVAPTASATSRSRSLVDVPAKLEASSDPGTPTR